MKTFILSILILSINLQQPDYNQFDYDNDNQNWNNSNNNRQNPWEVDNNTGEIKPIKKIEPRNLINPQPEPPGLNLSESGEMSSALFNKLQNKSAVQKPSQQPQMMSLSSNLSANRWNQKCRVRTGRKNTHWSWNSNHPFVNGSGTRNVWYWVPFSPHFPWGVKPKVEVNLYRIDATKDRNLRITATVDYRNWYGFVIKITTWADTKIYGAGYSFTAHHGCE